MSGTRDPDDPWMRPLSAKTGRKQFAAGGRERDGKYARSGDAQKLRAVLARRKLDADRRAKATKE